MRTTIEITGELLKVGSEVERATALHPRFNSSHEGFAVLKEEVDELWDAIKKNDITHAREEAVQVAAMAIRFLLDVHPKKGKK